jgi:GGDEF domain-containing protein
MEEMVRALEDYVGHKLTCSVGITFAYCNTFSYAQCLEEADEALYRSKQAGRNRHTYFDEL